MPSAIKFTAEQEQAICRWYTEGRPLKGLAQANRITVGPIYKVLYRNRIPIRTASEAKRALSLNQAAFADAENNPAAAYFVGLLMADGCVIHLGNSSQIILVLKITDAEHVGRFRQFLDSGAKITVARTQRSSFANGLPAARFVVSSRRLADDLARYGVVPCKSKGASVLRLERSRDFWRGVVDGDGGFYFAKGDRLPTMYLCGSRPMMEQFRLFVLHHCPDCQGVVRRDHSIWEFRIGARFACKMAEVLYKDASVALPRKAVLAERAMRFEGRHAQPNRSNLTAEKLAELKAVHGTWAEVGNALGMSADAAANIYRRRVASLA